MRIICVIRSIENDSYYSIVIIPIITIHNPSISSQPDIVHEDLTS